MRSLVLLLLLTLLAPATHAEAPLDLEMVEARWSYGPETWKENRFNEVDGRDTLQEQTTIWRASLGHALLVGVDVPAAGPEWRFEATLDDGNRVVAGKPVDGEADATFLFDVDGSRPLPGQGAKQPLVPGIWTLRLDATQNDAPQGWGRLQLQTDPIALVDVAVESTTRLRSMQMVQVPESFLPRFEEVGAGSNAWIPEQAVAGNQTVQVLVAGEPGTPLQWRAWSAAANPARVANAPGVPGTSGTPLEPVIPDPDALAVQFASIPLGNTTIGPDGLSTLRVAPDAWNRGPTTGDDLWAIAVVAEAQEATTQSVGGGAAFLLGRSDAGLNIGRIDAPPPGNRPPGSVTVWIDGTTGLATEVAAMHAGTILSQGLLAPTGADTARGELDANAIRKSGHNQYRIVSFPQDLRGDYLGHTAALRGLEAGLHVPAMGVGVSGEVETTLANLHPDRGPSGHSIEVNGALYLGATEVANRTVDIPGGGELPSTWEVTPQQAGDVQVRFVIDSGDLLFDARQTVRVLDAETFDKQQRAWYDLAKYTPGPAVGVVMLLLVTLVATRRNG